MVTAATFSKNCFTNEITMNQSINGSPSVLPLLHTEGHTLSLAKKVSFTAVCFVLCVFICMGNGLFLLAYTRTRALRTNSNLLLANVAAADLLVGLFLPYYTLFFWFPWLDHNSILCTFRFVFMMLPNIASILSLVLVAVDRYLAVSKPLKRSSLVTKGRLIKALASVWVITLLIGLLIILLRKDDHRVCEIHAIFRWELFALFLFPLFLVMWCALAFLYISICVIVFRNRNAVNKSIPTGIKYCIQTKYRKENNITKTVLFVMGTFSFGWLPYFIIYGVQLYTDRLSDQSLQSYRDYVARFLGFANSGINVITYACRIPLFRASAKAILSGSKTSVPSQRYSFVQRSRRSSCGMVSRSHLEGNHLLDPKEITV